MCQHYSSTPCPVAMLGMCHGNQCLCNGVHGAELHFQYRAGFEIPTTEGLSLLASRRNQHILAFVLNSLQTVETLISFIDSLPAAVPTIAHDLSAPMCFVEQLRPQWRARWTG